MNKKMWILVLGLILVVLLAVGVFVGVKTEFFGLLETKEEAKKEDDTKEDQTAKKEANAYWVDCSLDGMDEEIGMEMNFSAHFLKKDKSLLDMDTNIIVDFSSFEAEMTEDELKEAIASFEKELTDDMGLKCESNVDGTKAIFKCHGTKEEIVSALDSSSEDMKNMNYDEFLENMKDSNYKCSTKEVYVYIE